MRSFGVNFVASRIHPYICRRTPREQVVDVVPGTKATWDPINLLTTLTTFLILVLVPSFESSIFTNLICMIRADITSILPQCISSFRLVQFLTIAGAMTFVWFPIIWAFWFHASKRLLSPHVELHIL